MGLVFMLLDKKRYECLKLSVLLQRGIQNTDNVDVSSQITVGLVCYNKKNSTCLLKCDDLTKVICMLV